MAVELLKLKSSVKDAAYELDITSLRLSKWRNHPAFNGGNIRMEQVLAQIR